MNYYGNPITKLIEELASLPGIGGKSAQRLAFHIINMSEERVKSLANSILDAKLNVKYCSICCNLTDEDPCPVCSNTKRNKSIIMVVEIQEIWQHMKKQKSLMVFIMYYMELFLQCLGSTSRYKNKGTS